MDKWYYIAVGLFLVVMGGGMAWEKHDQNVCRMEAMKAGKSAEDIQKICR